MSATAVYYMKVFAALSLFAFLSIKSCDVHM
jgi:hypothetical protein